MIGLPLNLFSGPVMRSLENQEQTGHTKHRKGGQDLPHAPQKSLVIF